jgi:hypothetical protein
MKKFICKVLDGIKVFLGYFAVYLLGALTAFALCLVAYLNGMLK